MAKLQKESAVERRLVDGVKELGGECLKFVSPSMAGVPDRIILMPGGVVSFVEVKREGEQLSTKQRRFMQWMRENGFHACAVYGTVDVESVLCNLRKGGHV